MNKETLNVAIKEHKKWLSEFRKIYLTSDINFLKENLHIIKNSELCELGKCLESEDHKKADHTLTAFKLLHQTFHSVAEFLSLKIIEGRREIDIVSYIYELENISSLLISLIEFEKSRYID